MVFTILILLVVQSFALKNFTQLHESSGEGNLAAVRTLLRNATDIDVRDEVQRTPLHMAARIGSLEVTALLLKHDADVNAEDQVNQSLKQPL